MAEARGLSTVMMVNVFNTAFMRKAIFGKEGFNCSQRSGCGDKCLQIVEPTWLEP